jgi:hypothetical protein
MQPRIYLNPVGFVDFDPAGPTTIVSGKVVSVTPSELGPGNFRVNLDPNDALDPTSSFIAPSLVGGVIDGTITTDHATDVIITVATLAGSVATDRRFQLVIYDRGPQ